MLGITLKGLIEGEKKPIALDEFEQVIWFAKTYYGDGWSITLKYPEPYPITSHFFETIPMELPQKGDEQLTGIIHGGTRSKYHERRKNQIIRRLDRKRVRRLTVRGRS